ncbi:MAG: hypothetical protein JO254_14585 [Pseudolabrys sp.]|nr:hypothetical protein [Pseudolabrys sp.]
MSPVRGDDAVNEAGQAPPKAADESCVTDTANFQQVGDEAAFVIEVSSTCTVELSCSISAFIITADGPASGKTTLLLPAPGNGEPMRRRFEIKLKEAGGMANVSRKCQPA